MLKEPGVRVQILVSLVGLIYTPAAAYVLWKLQSRTLSHMFCLFSVATATMGLTLMLTVGLEWVLTSNEPVKVVLYNILDFIIPLFILYFVCKGGSRLKQQ